MPDSMDSRETRKQPERAFRKSKISRTHYESEMGKLDREITKREEHEAKAALESAFRNNPSASLEQDHIAVRLSCPCCGKSGKNTYGNIDFSVLGKDADGSQYFKSSRVRYTPAVRSNDRNY